MTKSKNRLVSFYFLLLLVLCSCRKTLDCNEFSVFLKQNSDFLKNSESISGIGYTIKMEPPELLAFRSYPINGDNKIDLLNEVKKYSKNIYCSLVIKDVESGLKVKQLISNKSNYFMLVGFANTELQEKFKLIVDGQIVFCTMCHLEPASSINPELRIALAFDYEPSLIYGQKSKGCEVVYEDDIFNNGIIKFSFDVNDLHNWPELKI